MDKLTLEPLTAAHGAELLALWQDEAVVRYTNMALPCTPEEAERLAYLRKVFPSLLLTGPFSIILGFNGGLMALNDRLKLRSMVVAEKDDRVFIASEEAAIRTMEPEAENVWAPMGGEPVIVRVKEGMY